MRFQDLRATLIAAPFFQVDIDHSDQIPGYVRSVRFLKQQEIAVYFDEYQIDEGGLYFYAPILDMAASVKAVESYIGRPLSEWRCCLDSYPEPLRHKLKVEEGRALIKELLSTETLRLPSGHSFKIGSSYWSQFVPDHMNALLE